MGFKRRAGNNALIIRQRGPPRKGRRTTTQLPASAEAGSKDPPRRHEGHEEKQVRVWRLTFAVSRNHLLEKADQPIRAKGLPVFSSHLPFFVTFVPSW
jgi:hypothetical protein